MLSFLQNPAWRSVDRPLDISQQGGCLLFQWVPTGFLLTCVCWFRPLTAIRHANRYLISFFPLLSPRLPSPTSFPQLPSPYPPPSFSRSLRIPAARAPPVGRRNGNTPLLSRMETGTLGKPTPPDSKTPPPPPPLPPLRHWASSPTWAPALHQERASLPISSL